jgi:drug/metabolite transporter (DMT)-like permease
MGPVEWVLLVVLAIVWGGSYIFNRIALGDLPPLTLVLGRVALAAVLMNLLVLGAGLRMPTAPRRWAALVGMALLNNVAPFCLIVWGQTQVASGLAAILNATVPLWTVLLAHLITHDERLTPATALGVAAGFGGIVVLVGPSALAGVSSGLLGQIAVVGAAVSYACASLYGRRFAGTPPLVTATGQVTAAALVMLPLALLADRPWTLAAPHAATVGAVVGLAVLSTTLAYVLYFRILAVAGATNLMLVTFLIPISALALGAAILGERVEPRHLAGMALIGLGLAAIDGRLPALLARPSPSHTRTSRSAP